MTIQLKILRKRWFNKNTLALEFYLPGIKPLPGQFFQVRVSEALEPFLNRPISIASYFRNKLFLIIKVVGKGTKMLSEKKEGEYLTLLGPFGNGLKPKRKKSLILAGGIGVAPLYFLAQSLYKNRVNFTFLYGAKTQDEIILKWNIMRMANESIFITEHGKNRGTVVSAVKHIPIDDYEVAYTCGPKEMLIELQKLNLPLPIYAFCEDFLGCGCGLCLGCAIMYKGKYKRICEDGPVFQLREINFEV
jgi:dihydroorotate dehydrogenase electron transfer subunit